MSEEEKPNLTDKQRRFVEEYCIDWNATQAAIRAGYSERTARSTGCENLTKPDIAAAIDERLRKLSMSAGEALKRLTDWGRSDFSPFLRVTGTGEVVLDLSTAEAQANLHLVKKVKVEETRVVEGETKDVVHVKTQLELHDAKDAVKQLAKAHGLFIDRIDVTTDGKPLFKSYQGVDIDDV